MDISKTVFSDEAFVQSLFEMETVTEVQEALKNRGIEVSVEELLDIRALFDKVESGEISQEQLKQWVTQSENGGLSDEMLEQVAGGSITVAVAAGLAALWKVAGGYIMGTVGLTLFAGGIVHSTGLHKDISRQGW